jgi:hypothetical protein
MSAAGTVSRRPVSARPASGRTVRAAAMSASAAPMHRDRGNEPVVQMDRGARTADDLDGFSLRRVETHKGECKQRVPENT